MDTDELIEKAIIAPVIILVGMYVAGAVIGSMLHSNTNLFGEIFAAAGGIPAVGIYFARLWKES